MIRISTLPPESHGLVNGLRQISELKVEKKNLQIDSQISVNHMLSAVH